MAVLEDKVCSRREELLRPEGLVCEQWWDSRLEEIDSLLFP
jgi:hypothetical protein